MAPYLSAFGCLALLAAAGGGLAYLLFTDKAMVGMLIPGAAAALALVGIVLVPLRRRQVNLAKKPYSDYVVSPALSWTLRLVLLLLLLIVAAAIYLALLQFAVLTPPPFISGANLLGESLYPSSGANAGKLTSGRLEIKVLTLALAAIALLALAAVFALPSPPNKEKHYEGQTGPKLPTAGATVAVQDSGELVLVPVGTSNKANEANDSKRNSTGSFGSPDPSKPHLAAPGFAPMNPYGSSPAAPPSLAPPYDPMAGGPYARPPGASPNGPGPMGPSSPWTAGNVPPPAGGPSPGASPYSAPSRYGAPPPPGPSYRPPPGTNYGANGRPGYGNSSGRGPAPPLGASPHDDATRGTFMSSNLYAESEAPYTPGSAPSPAPGSAGGYQDNTLRSDFSLRQYGQPPAPRAPPGPPAPAASAARFDHIAPRRQQAQTMYLSDEDDESEYGGPPPMPPAAATGGGPHAGMGMGRR
ncbi:hypothetical protein AMAG_01345 [Allomyces macrogynus ATCC 38327]|uniref:Uncharacterized protein n=1 Tax=Allomyces macrogynus (strain ATCC 38327) TaxID=578462 RepID=A0A0L0RYN0_ALLM3|nr:hypothetical protein AMAG_01345 [Allomyces macrogynus ATCC 38327]|eukprot:KNE55453.1 hypothetical protein AMAG_01345 [Allomyces macrogynus ATCC 38327]